MVIEVGSNLDRLLPNIPVPKAPLPYERHRGLESARLSQSLAVDKLSSRYVSFPTSETAKCQDASFEFFLQRSRFA
jgi:hypothetical protein